MTMHRLQLPIVALSLFLLVSIPELAFATSSSEGDLGSSGSTSISTKTKKSDDDLGDEILETIFSLGGLLDFGGSGGSTGSGSTSGDGGEGSEGGGLIETVSIPPSTDPVGGDGNLATPVPEPTGALLFGFGILAVATRRSRAV